MFFLRLRLVGVFDKYNCIVFRQAMVEETRNTMKQRLHMLGLLGKGGVAHKAYRVKKGFIQSIVSTRNSKNKGRVLVSSIQ